MRVDKASLLGIRDLRCTFLRAVDLFRKLFAFIDAAFILADQADNGGLPVAFASGILEPLPNGVPEGDRVALIGVADGHHVKPHLILRPDGCCVADRCLK